MLYFCSGDLCCVGLVWLTDKYVEMELTIHSLPGFPTCRLRAGPQWGEVVGSSEQLTT